MRVTGSQTQPAERSSVFTLITGASRGIGLELAREAAADGRNLILVARNAHAHETAAGALRRSVTVHTIAEDSIGFRLSGQRWIA
jgi:short-subunit dehydrogenase